MKVQFDLNRNISDLWSREDLHADKSSGFVRQFFVGQPEMTCQRTEYSRSNQVLLTNKSVETLFQTNDKNFVIAGFSVSLQLSRFEFMNAAHDLKNQLFNK
ncbi:hypothetical protein T11_18333 [Trichinella zimbabwensis]|uniref:Uncharacterized protein n=1 Tax=Trichinella zimbabwensis TaxID=268475 RepID=A0A0V1HTA9_9BILA|nr:hypothetical protein T11_18333 [Trichinella zimbabwensis]